MKRKVGLSIWTFQRMYGDENALKLAKEIGADAVDFNLCGPEWDYRNKESVYSRSDAEIIAYFEKIKKKADEIGIEIAQTHGRISAIKNEEKYDKDVYENARLDCLATSVMGAPVCVMHGVTTMDFGPDADPKLMHRLNFEFFTNVLKYAKKYGIKIATETFGDATAYKCCDFFGNANEFIMSYNRICASEDFKDWFVTCVDTGHSNKATRFNNNPSPGDVIRLLGGSVAVLHLNDNNTLTDQHKIPLMGEIDWDDVMSALDEVGYSGVYNMEIVLTGGGEGLEKETAAYAVKVMRNILGKRYGEN